MRKRLSTARFVVNHKDKINRLIGGAHDLLVACLAFVAANFFASDVLGFSLISGFAEKTLLFGACSGFVFYYFELNRGSWKYASIPDLIAIVKAATVVNVVYLLIAFFYSNSVGISRTIPILLWFFLILFLSAPRILFRLVREQGLLATITGVRKPNRSAKSILIYKYNDVSEAYLRAVNLRKDSGIHVAGIIDDNIKNRSRNVQNAKVLGTLANLQAIVLRLQAHNGITINEIALADHSLTREQLDHLVNVAGGCGLIVSQIPDIVRTSDLQIPVNLNPYPLELSDLLGRPEVTIDFIEVTRFIEGRTILLTGAGGSIGSELARQIAGFNPNRLIVSDISEHFLYTIDLSLREMFPNLDVIPKIADVRDRERVNWLFSKFRPDIVFHAAAIKHVPLSESNVTEAIKTNIFGSKNCADAALAYGTPVFVMISTDKAVNPTNVLGATKRVAESYCQALDVQSEKTRFKTVRFGNVLGSNGSVVPRFASQIAKGGPVTVTHPNVVRYFMTTPEAVRLVLQASALGASGTSEKGKILVLDMGEPVRIATLAERMISLAGLRLGVDIKIEYTGLRPGEKLFEELFDRSEVKDSMSGETYLIASPRVIDLPILNRMIDQLSKCVAKEDVDGCITQLRNLVPEYTKSKSIGADNASREQQQSGTDKIV